MLTMGCHLSSAKGYLNMAQTATSIGANTFQFFTRNPRGAKAKAIDPMDVKAFTRYTQEQGITKILAHAPYTLNAASEGGRVREFAHETFADDLVRMENTPHQMYNLHPGSYVKQSVEDAIKNTAEVLNAVLRPEQTTTVLLETMSGKGTEIGQTFEELATIIKRVDLDDHVGICLDTCHVWAAGYDIVGDLEGVLESFDNIIGLSRLRAFHVNDSKHPFGSHKDGHAKIGEGTIGFEALAKIINHPLLHNLSFYLETPNDLDGFAEEISFFKSSYLYD